MVQYKRISKATLIVLSLLFSTVSSFGISFFSPGFSKYAGGSNMMVFTSDSPKLVNVKIAVQNPDNTLTSIDSATSYNVASGDFVSISIPKGVQPAINYWFVAVDTADASHYATLGPFTISGMFDNTNPSSSVSATGSGSAYQTGGGAGNSASATPTPSGSSLSSSKATPTATDTNTTTGKGSSTTAGNRSAPTSKSSSSDDSSNDSNSNGSGSNQQNSAPLSTGAIAGIAAGGAVVALVVLWRLYRCCCVPAARPVYNTSGSNTGFNINNESTIPMTSTVPPVGATAVPAVPQKESKQPTTPSLASTNQQYQQPLVASPSTTTSTLNNTSNNNGSEYTFNPSHEQAYNYQNTFPQAQQQSYPAYPYPSYNPNVQQQQQNGYPYPTQDSMPVPEHFAGDHQGYYPQQPLSPSQMNSNYNNYAFYQQQQQPYPAYSSQQSYGYYNGPAVADHQATYVYPPPMAEVTGGLSTASLINGVGAGTLKTEEAISNKAAATVAEIDTPLSQKVEYDGVKADKETEYPDQKPDAANAVNQQHVYNKPDDISIAPPQQNHKPHERKL